MNRQLATACLYENIFWFVGWSRLKTLEIDLIQTLEKQVNCAGKHSSSISRRKSDFVSKC